MRSFAFLAAIAASSGFAFAQSNTWSSWESVTTTVTLTLLHVNQTVTSTSYSHSATAKLTSSSYQAPSVSATPTEATIASFATGAAVAQEANFAVAGLLGMGALAYGLL